ncbi:MAG: hypothetical protein IJV35_09740 [Neisseriaceae bacterium]|nr:hypothetical protein [Neisseriaceae bacterium]
MPFQRLRRCVLPVAKLDCHDFASQNLAMTLVFIFRLPEQQFLQVLIVLFRLPEKVFCMVA